MAKAGRQSPTGHVSPRELKPGRSWYLVATLVLVALALAGVVGGVTVIAKATSELKVLSSQPQQVTFEQDEKKVLYVSRGTTRVTVPRCRQEEGPGQLHLRQLKGNSTRTVDDTTWKGVGTVTASKPGTYEVACTPPAGAKVAVGRHTDATRGSPLGDPLGSPLGGIAIIIGGIVLGLSAGGGIAIVVLARRNSYKKALQNTKPATE